MKADNVKCNYPTRKPRPVGGELHSGYGKHKGAQGGERPEIVFSGLKDPQTPEAIVTDILKTYRSTGE